MEPFKDKKKSENFPEHKRRLRALHHDILEVAPDFDFQLGLKILGLSETTGRKRQLPKGEHFSDPFVLLKALVDLSGADTETLYAAILTARPDPSFGFNTDYLGQIANLFRNEEGVVEKRFQEVKDIFINVLQLRASRLIAPRHPIKDVESAFDKPSADDAKKLAKYFMLTNLTVEDERAFKIQATKWYLRLVDMRENPARYTEDQRLNAYYYTDKFYGPFCEYLALKNLTTNPSYSPQDEGRGFYRLKTAMDEELLRQINPEAYAEIQSELHDILHGFEFEKNQRNRKIKKFESLVRRITPASCGETQAQLLEILDGLNTEKEIRRNKIEKIEQLVREVYPKAHQEIQHELQAILKGIEGEKKIGQKTVGRLKELLNPQVALLEILNGLDPQKKIHGKKLHKIGDLIRLIYADTEKEAHGSRYVGDIRDRLQGFADKIAQQEKIETETIIRLAGPIGQIEPKNGDAARFELREILDGLDLGREVHKGEIRKIVDLAHLVCADAKGKIQTELQSLLRKISIHENIEADTALRLGELVGQIEPSARFELLEILDGFEFEKGPYHRRNIKTIDRIERLVQQLSPASCKTVQSDLLKELQGFDEENRIRADLRGKGLFDRVRIPLEGKIRALISDAGIPLYCVRIEARLKNVRSLYQKVRAKRTDIHDQIGIRVIIDFEAWKRQAGDLAAGSRKKVQDCSTHYCTKILAEVAKNFVEVPRRYKNFYVKPYEPDNGYRTVQNTFRLGRRKLESRHVGAAKAETKERFVDFEGQAVGLKEHICNCLGNASHIRHKLVAEKKGEKKTGATFDDIKDAFSTNADTIVVRIPDDLVVLKAGATARMLLEAVLAKHEIAALKDRQISAVITDRDPIHPMCKEAHKLDQTLRNGQEIWFIVADEVSGTRRKRGMQPPARLFPTHDRKLSKPTADSASVAGGPGG